MRPKLSSLRPLLLLGALLSAALFASPGAHASTVLATSIEALAQQADAIVIGQVTHVECTRVEGRIVTEVTLEPERSLGSEVPTSIIVRVPGGRLGEFATRVAGASVYELGERVLVFLSNAPDGTYVSTSMSFSKFTLLDDPQGHAQATRAPDGLTLVTAPGVEITPPDIERNTFDLDELIDIISSVIEDQE